MKWLYCADDSGIFRKFDLSKKNKFKKILKIETNLKKGIFSAIIFEDKFQNISKNEKNEFAYVALAFYDQDAFIHHAL